MKEHPTSRKKRDRQAGRYAWPIQVFFLAIGLSAALSLASQGPLSGAGILAAALILALFIALGILFDIIGVAVTAADPRPFHSMAAHREKGAKEALMLLRNAGRVSSVCNDVVGDICGIVSGTTAAVIVTRLQTALGLAEDLPQGPAYASYADIAGKWYEDSVELLTLYGALIGGGTGSFEGDEPASRADFVTMIARALGQGSSADDGEIPFTDVPADAWYFAPVQLAWKSGWLEEQESFRPLETITAKEAWGFLATVGESCGIDDSLTWAQEVWAEAEAQQQAALPDWDNSLVTRGAAAYLAAALVEVLNENAM